MSDPLEDRVAALAVMVEKQRRQIACLAGFVGTLLGALQTKEVLHPDDAGVLAEIIEEISPRPKDNAVKSVLRAVEITAAETPQMMEMPSHGRKSPQPHPLHHRQR